MPNMMYKRKIKKRIIKALSPGRVVILYGARQVGKTTLVKQIIKELGLKTLYVNADQAKYRKVLSSQDADVLREFIGTNELLVIDEAQRIENIGLNLKIITDEIPEKKVLVTGSSSFELANEIQEPLTGRKRTFRLYPMSVQELMSDSSSFDIRNNLDKYLVFGAYPVVASSKGKDEKIEYLTELSESYLYKDALQLEEVRKSPKVRDLLKLLAYQVGSEASLSELGSALDLGKKTVSRYVDLLEKSFVIFSLGGFSRNLRKEVSKSYKYYFYDLGVRNMLIDDFHSIDERNDVGALWENFIILERMKYLDYSNIRSSRYFWRTYTGAEIDYVEERQGKLLGVEIKWGKKTPSAPRAWLETYDSRFKVINRDNWLAFVS